MELKSEILGSFSTSFFSSNRTFMELKLGDGLSEFFESEGSNRTFMELKFVPGTYASSRLQVLIVPLWN